MTLSELATFGSVLSSFAVCGSLIYLALQVRQSDRNQRTLLQHGLSSRHVEVQLRLGESHFAEVFARCIQGETDFTPAEFVELHSMVRATILNLQDQYLLKKNGLIDVTQIETQERGAKSMFANPSFRAMWNLTRDRYAPEFAEYVDVILKDVPVAVSTLQVRHKATATELKPSRITLKPT